MKRRNFVIGAGALATGSAAAVGSGAFSSVEADRDVSVEVADDSDAYLALDATDNDTDFIDQDESGRFRIRLDDSVTPGEGLNPDAVTQLRDAFIIRYQGTQAEGDFGGGGIAVDVFNDGERVEDDDVLDAITFNVRDTTGAIIDLIGPGRRRPVLELEVGEEASVNIEIDTTTLDDGGDGTLVDQITFLADPDPSSLR